MQSATDAIITMQARTKNMGSREALAHIKKSGLPFDEVRCGPFSIQMARVAFDACIASGELVKGVKYMWFREGWRGSALNHGTPSAYTQGCRCYECRNAWRQYYLDRKKKKQLALAGEKMDLAAEHTARMIEGQERALAVIAETEFRLRVAVAGADSIGWGSFSARVVNPNRGC